MADIRRGATLSFLTPYWSGRAMMRIHLGSIREFHPSSPILVSKRGGEPEEMEAHRAIRSVPPATSTRFHSVKTPTASNRSK